MNKLAWNTYGGPILGCEGAISCKNEIQDLQSASIYDLRIPFHGRTL